MKFGVTSLIQPRGLSTITFSACGRSSKTIHPTRATSFRYTAKGTSSWDSSMTNVHLPVGAVYDRAQSKSAKPCMVSDRNNARSHRPGLQQKATIRDKELLRRDTWKASS